MDTFAFTATDVHNVRFALHVNDIARTEECSIREELMQYVRADDDATPQNVAEDLARLQADYDSGMNILRRADLIAGPVAINHEPYPVPGENHSPEVEYQEGWAAMSPRRRLYALRLRGTH